MPLKEPTVNGRDLVLLADTCKCWHICSHQQIYQCAVRVYWWSIPMEEGLAKVRGERHRFRAKQGHESKGYQVSQVLYSEDLHSWWDGDKKVRYWLMGKGGGSFLRGTWLPKCRYMWVSVSPNPCLAPDSIYSSGCKTDMWQEAVNSSWGSYANLFMGSFSFCKH